MTNFYENCTERNPVFSPKYPMVRRQKETGGKNSTKQIISFNIGSFKNVFRVNISFIRVSLK